MNKCLLYYTQDFSKLWAFCWKENSQPFWDLALVYKVKAAYGKLKPSSAGLIQYVLQMFQFRCLEFRNLEFRHFRFRCFKFRCVEFRCLEFRCVELNSDVWIWMNYQILPCHRGRCCLYQAIPSMPKTYIWLYFIWFEFRCFDILNSDNSNSDVPKLVILNSDVLNSDV